MSGKAIERVWFTVGYWVVCPHKVKLQKNYQKSKKNSTKLYLYDMIIKSLVTIERRKVTHLIREQRKPVIVYERRL